MWADQRLIVPFVQKCRGRIQRRRFMLRGVGHATHLSEWPGGTRISRTDVNPMRVIGKDCDRDVATDEVRKASRSRAFDSPVPGECRKHERPGQTEKTDAEN